MKFLTATTMVVVFSASTILATGVAPAYAQCEVAKLVGSDTEADDRFSFESAACIDGDYMVVGAPMRDNGGISRSGSAYVFFNSNGTWIEVAKLVPSDPEPNDTFGIRVSISGDWIVVPAHEHTWGTGSAYMFFNSNGHWIETQKLIPSDAEPGDSFGVGVSIDGDHAVIGAFDDEDAGYRSGSAYVFVNSNGTWIKEDKIIPHDLATGDRFGYAASISGDYALVSSHNDDDAGNDSGSAYVFMNSNGNWIETQKLTASDGEAYDSFGGALAIDGDYAAIGALHDDDGGDNSGSAYVFRRDDNGTPDYPYDDVWTEQDKLTASDAESGDSFGFAVAIYEDWVVVGAYKDDDVTGSAYLFRREDNGTPADPNDDTWIEELKLRGSDAVPGDGCGLAVSIDGDYVAVGASYSDAAGTDSGAAYVFHALGPPDCNLNGVNDNCESFEDCNSNGVPDECDIAASAKVYWTDWGTDKIQRSGLDGADLEDVLTSGLTTPVGIAVDLLGRKVYWADQAEAKIKRANLDGTGVEDVVTAPYLDAPQDIALDVAGGKMYWVDHGTDSVGRADLDGLNSNVETTLYGLYLGELHGITLDLQAGMIYWTWQTESKLLHAPMDGSGPVEELLSDLPYEIYGIAVDSVNGHLYWSSFPGELIRRGSLDGTNAQLFVSDVGHPPDLAVDPVGGYLYWGRYLEGQVNEKVQRTRLLPGSPIEDVVTGLENIWGICVLPTLDCNGNDILDECDIADCGPEELWCGDCNSNDVLDACEADFDGDGLIDDCDPDIDNDTVSNEDDVCDYTPSGANIVTDPEDPLYGTLRGDLDGDCDCDLADYAILQADFTGPNA